MHCTEIVDKKCETNIYLDYGCLLSLNSGKDSFVTQNKKKFLRSSLQRSTLVQTMDGYDLHRCAVR